MTADWNERAAYQRAIESAKNQIALLVRERDEARGQVQKLHTKWRAACEDAQSERDARVQAEAELTLLRARLLDS